MSPLLVRVGLGLFMMIRNKMAGQSSLVCPLMVVSLLLGGVLQINAAPRANNPKKAVVSKVPLKVQFVTVNEPTENAYTTKVPKGWRNQVYLSRKYQLIRSVMTSLSPDGQTLLFSGDPRMPTFTVPNEFTQSSDYQIVASFNPLMKLSYYVSSKDYFTGYVRAKFGKLPNFRITSVVPNPEVIKGLQESAKRTGFQGRHDAVRIRFSYTDKGKPMHALINGMTLSNDSLWVPDINGITTPGDPMRFNQVLLDIMNSVRTNPQWKEQQQALHNQRMAQLQQDHQNQLATWSASNQSHALRMQAIQSVGNASMQKWYQNQAKSDDSHRAFLNTITEEKTVVDKSGTAYQVDNSHQKYFVNKNDRTYVGTPSTTSIYDLQEMGFNPSDYEEVRVKR